MRNCFKYVQSKLKEFYKKHLAEQRVLKRKEKELKQAMTNDYDEDLMDDGNGDDIESEERKVQNQSSKVADDDEDLFRLSFIARITMSTSLLSGAYSGLLMSTLRLLALSSASSMLFFPFFFLRLGLSALPW